MAMSKEAVSLNRVRKINYNVDAFPKSLRQKKMREHQEARDIQSAQAELSREGCLKAEVMMIYILQK